MVDKDISIFRQDTEEVININPCEIEIVRSKETEDEYGSVSSETIRLEKQTVRIAELSHSETQRLFLEGLLKNHIVNITAKHDADIEAGDKFGYCGKTYKVMFIRNISVGGQTPDKVFRKSGRAEEINEEI